jgi:hypothetical protein
MKATEKEEGSGSKAAKDEGRREALKKFGELAAAAPAAMVLLKSRRAAAPPVCDPQYDVCF